LRRRDLLAASTLVPLAGLVRDAAAQTPPRSSETTPFTSSTVRQLAREIARKPFQRPDASLPARLDKLTYDQYRAIRFRPERTLWRGQGLPFEAQLFHRGLFYDNRVDIHEVAGGQARRLAYSSDMFSFAFEGAEPPPAGVDLGFAGFRLHAPFNKPEYFDEMCVFLGASYFRAVGKGQAYGLSARGLSIKTADPAGEEFPFFRAFWIERPSPNASATVVHALLDSQSAAGAFRFTIRPGDTTLMDVEMTLHPRVEIAQAGIGTLTSMFFFGPLGRRTGPEDFRPAVHDSNTLAIWNGRGERLVRPLNNPTDLQVNSFLDQNPRGFGLMQRQRTFLDFQDIEARYERRPSLWVEPIGDWGEGSVMLVEIPTKDEVNDNVVAFWRPKEPLRAGGEYSYTYRLHWASEDPMPGDLARFVRHRSGASLVPGGRLFVLEALGGKLAELPPDTVLTPLVTASDGGIVYPVVVPNPELGGWRFWFTLMPENAVADLRAQIFLGAEPVSEVWTYRWMP